MQNVDFVGTVFTGQTDFIVVQYSITSTAGQSDNFVSKVTQQSELCMRESIWNVFAPFFCFHFFLNWSSSILFFFMHSLFRLSSVYSFFPNVKCSQKVHHDIIFCVKEAADLYETFPGMSVLKKNVRYLRGYNAVTSLPSDRS